MQEFINAISEIGLDNVFIPLSHPIVCYLTYRITRKHCDETTRKIGKYFKEQNEL